MDSETYDVAVIGSGFGGMGAALELARSGASVVMYEALKYPGGCASTYSRRGHRFESGATLFSGFGPGQLFDRWTRELELDITFEALDPMVELRTPSFSIEVSSDRDTFLDRFCALPGANDFPVREFFAKQKAVADTLWGLFDDPAMLPPFGVKEVLGHIAKSPSYASLLPLVNTSLDAVLRRWGVAEFDALRTYLNAVCQITIQTSVAEAEAPFAFATMDYFFRGTGHVHGGVGHLAWALCHAFERLGGTLSMADKVGELNYEDGAWTVVSRRKKVRAQHVVANMLPQDLSRIANVPSRRLNGVARRVEAGWGAAMLYLSVPTDVEAPEPHHLELVADEQVEFIEGNHVFCSISGVSETDRTPEPGRTITCSTHVPISKLRTLDPEAQGVYINGVQQRMRDTIALRAPELVEDVRLEMPGSPRTFQRFTLRSEGLVGGIPRRVGLANYGDIFPRPFGPNLYLVGDSVFPGQSTLATAIGGVKVAQQLLR